MEYYTLQDFLTHSKGIIYVIMGCILVAVTLWWRFLMGGKDD